ncbi:H-2 class II histocompatibility antigen, E-S beta chain-like [Astyanax mexicanus]|uniref:H-2 class II histocompatibility antigen, E-S beta chain-like n=1 Tax=Astyanax mexicanus TaxID=7994 RepID=UPI0020CB2A5A|nr:H-2 class II histocompatibility antigen, E-S beta chain-like [Astyanax mexicanus]
MILTLQLLLLLTLSSRTDGYNWYRATECVFSEALTDVEYIDTYYFNKDAMLRFNSTVGKFVGYTELGVKNAERFNKGPELQQYKAQRDGYCTPNIQIDHSHVLVKSVPPKVEVMLEQEQASGGDPAMLICNAYNFYPPAINVYWLKNGKKVTGDITVTEEMADGDWYYQFHSHLEYTPKSGEKISCVVEHVSSAKAIRIDWDPSLPETDRNKIAIGSSGLVLGLVLSAAGFIYYKKKSTGRILVPS